MPMLGTGSDSEVTHMEIPEIKRVSIRIPDILLKEFKEEARVVIKYPSMIGVPLARLKPGMLEQLQTEIAKEKMVLCLVPEEYVK